MYSDSLDTVEACITCISPCKTCTKETLTDCNSCITGYYILGTTCDKCPKGCVSCLAPDNCD